MQQREREHNYTVHVGHLKKARCLPSGGAFYHLQSHRWHWWSPCAFFAVKAPSSRGNAILTKIRDILGRKGRRSSVGWVGDPGAVPPSTAPRGPGLEPRSWPAVPTGPQVQEAQGERTNSVSVVSGLSLPASSISHGHGHGRHRAVHRLWLWGCWDGISSRWRANQLLFTVCTLEEIRTF